MKKSSLTAVASMLGLALVLPPVTNMQAAELQVLAGGAMTGPLKELGSQFESASGHKLVFRFGTTPELIKLATAGGPFDLGIVPREVLKDAAAQAQFASGPFPESAAGYQVSRAFERLGISEAMKAKTKVQASPVQIVQAVATGDAELGVFLVNVLTAPGLDVVGPFPAELQQEIIFTAGAAANTKEAEAAKAFITYLKTPAAAAVIKVKGMTPG